MGIEGRDVEMKIIAFGYKSRVGKDTAAKFLINYLRVNRQGLKVERVGFADKIKAVCADLFGLQHRIYYENHPNERKTLVPSVGKTVEDIWIEVASAMRSVYRDVWLDYIFRVSEAVDVLVVTDLRFPEEVERIQSLGGICVKIVKSDVVDRSKKLDYALDGFDSWDEVIHNEGTLGELYGRVVDIWEKS